MMPKPDVQELFEYNLGELDKLIATNQKAAAGLYWGSMRTIYAMFPTLMMRLDPYLEKYHAMGKPGA